MSPGISLRLARAEDAGAMWHVRSAAIRHGCRNHYLPQLLSDWTAAPMQETFTRRIVDQAFVVADLDARIIGFAGLAPERCEIDAVFVHPDFSGRKLGSLLLARIESDAHRLGIAKVRLKASLNAVAFYTAAGYSALNEGCHITPGGLHIACLHMDKQLSPDAAS